MLDDPAQVADPVAVGVGEAPRVDLVDDGVTPPWVSRSEPVGAGTSERGLRRHGVMFAERVERGVPPAPPVRSLRSNSAVRRSHGAVRTARFPPDRFPPSGCPLDAVVDRTLPILTIGLPGGIVETPCPARTGARLVSARWVTTTTPVAVPGDTKDWTWVLEQRCPECGFDPASIDVADVPDAGAGQRRRLAARARPSGRPATAPARTSGRRWSTAATCATCSACSTPRLGLMLAEDDPLFANWDQDETAVADRYHEPGPGRRGRRAGRRGRRTSRRRSPPSRASSGSGSAGAATARCSPCARSPGTSSTTRCTTCRTSAARRGDLSRDATGSGAPPVRPTRSACQLSGDAARTADPASLSWSDAAPGAGGGQSGKPRAARDLLG